MARVLNIFFSSRKDHAAANYLHSELSQNLLVKGYKVTGLCLSGEKKDWSEHMFMPDLFWQYHRSVVKGKKVLASFLLRRRLAKLISNGQFDIIICDGLGALNLLASVPMHNISSVIAIQHAPPRSSDKPSSFVKTLFAYGKVTMVAISVMVKERLCVAGYGNDNQIALIPNAINFDAIRKAQLSRGEALSALSLDHTMFVIGVVGRLVGCKQQRMLLEAMVILRHAGRLPADWRVAIIGEGPELDNLKQYSQNHHLDRYVTFTGALDNASCYMKALDLFVMTSNEEEGFGLVILEAMAANVPVIANDTTVFRNLVTDESCRFSLNDAESLAEHLLAFYQMSIQDREKVACRQVEYAVNLYDIKKFNSAYELLIKKKLSV